MVEEAIFIKSEDTIVLKKALAKALYGKNVDQSEISKILNLSQPMVSIYLASDEKIPKKILELVDQIVDKIIDKNKTLLYTCITLSDKDLGGNFYIARKNELLSDENQKIVNDMTEAFSILKGKDIGKILPKIKINIATAKENAENSEDVASFLNGLIIVDDKVTSHNGIRFGESKHLSSLILSFKNSLDFNSIMNIAYVNDLEDMNFNIGYLTKDYKLKDISKKFDILLHEGDFGIEPCAYVLGSNSIDVSKKVLRIIEAGNNEK